MISTGLVALSCAAVLTPGANAAAGSPVQTDTSTVRLDRGLDRLVEAGAPGAALLSRSYGRTLTLASGVADLATQRPLRANDRFRVGSLTKTYVATVILQLSEERKLSLDTPIETYVPGLVPAGEGISVRQLLNHTSGLFEYEHDPRVFEPYLAGDFNHVTTPRQLVRIAVSHPPLFAPGSRYSYSNTNYIVAGLIVETVTSNTLESEVQRRIIKPLRLRATTMPISSKLAGRHAHGYYVFDSPPATDVTYIFPFQWAAGSIAANTRDVATFYRSLMRGKLLSPASMRAMKSTVPVPADQGGGDYGLGLARFPTPCGPAWGHNGNQPGYEAVALTSARGGHQSVLMINIDPSALSGAAIEKFEGLAQEAYCRGRR